LRVTIRTRGKIPIMSMWILVIKIHFHNSLLV